jgi:mannosyltransferase
LQLGKFSRISNHAATPGSDRPLDAAVSSRFSWVRGVSNETWCVAALTIVAAILRIAFLDSKSLWVDEGMTACRNMWPISHLFPFILHREMNMFLYYLMIHAWTSVAGANEFMLRFPSVLFDTASVPIIYALGVALGERRAGLFAAVMLTLNASAIEYAQTARSYAMLAMLTILAAVFFIRSLRDPSPRNLAGYIVSATCAVYAQLFGIFALPAQALFLLWYQPERKIAKRVGLSIIVVGIFSLPAFYFGISGYHGNIAWVPKLTFGSIPGLFGFFSGAFDQRATALTLALSVLYLAGVGIAIILPPRENRSAPTFLLLSILAPIGLAAVISLFRSIFLARYLLAGLPFYALLAALGFARLKPKFGAAMLLMVAIVSGAGIYSYYDAPPVQDWRGATEFIATHSKASDGWIIYPDSCGCLFSFYSPQFPAAYPMVFGQREDDRNVDLLVQRLSGIGTHHHGRRVWLTFPLNDQPDLKSLRTTFPSGQITDESGLAGIGVVLFEPPK